MENLKKPGSHVEYKGFTPERELFVKELIVDTGLPTQKVTRVRYSPNTSESGNVLGQAHLTTGEVTFYKLMEGIPAIAQVGVAVHELTHVNSPFLETKSNVYGSLAERKNACRNATLVAAQTDESHKFLNPYHKALYYKYVSGKAEDFDPQRFVEETNAIMIELRFTNLEHLKEVLNAQSSENADEILKQIDKTLLALMPQFNGSVTRLNQHISNLRKNYLQ